MTSRELRNQRLDEPAILSEPKTEEGEAERKARKRAYQQSRAAATSAAETCGAGSFAGEPVARPAYTPCDHPFALPPNPDLFDEFSAGEQMEMMALRARVHSRADRDASIADPARVDEPAVLSAAKIQVDEPAVLACEARLSTLAICNSTIGVTNGGSERERAFLGLRVR